MHQKGLDKNHVFDFTGKSRNIPSFQHVYHLGKFYSLENRNNM